ncbi:MAG: biotin/lipoyl-binding protein [Gammaproteobacteria bacterium]|nr:MAG: biotin/lipoyl-binding protein [Gammaproteobacteria bacterium]
MNVWPPQLNRFKPKTLKTKRIAMSGGILFVAVLTSASIFATGPDAEPEIRTEKSWPVSVLAIEPKKLNPTFSAYGRIESSNVAKIRTDLIAEVVAVHVKEGDWVAKGSVLLTLDDAEARLRVLQREAELTQHQAKLQSIKTEFELKEQTTAHYASMQHIAQNKLTRHEELLAERLISQLVLDEVVSQSNQATIQYQSHIRQLADAPNQIASQNAQIAKAEALLAQAELDLDKTLISAPFSGPVLGVFVAPGDRSNLGTVLVELVDASAFEVRVPVPEVHNNRFANYKISQIVATTSTGQHIPLTRLSSQVRRGQIGVDAFFKLTVTADASLPVLGRLIDLTITMPGEPNVVALPVQSIYENDRIYEVRENRLRAIAIERVGEYQTESGEYRILVRSHELNAGQKIITTQLPKAISGLLVASG